MGAQDAKEPLHPSSDGSSSSQPRTSGFSVELSAAGTNPGVAQEDVSPEPLRRARASASSSSPFGRTSPGEFEACKIERRGLDTWRAPVLRQWWVVDDANGEIHSSLLDDQGSEEREETLNDLVLDLVYVVVLERLGAAFGEALETPGA